MCIHVFYVIFYWMSVKMHVYSRFSSAIYVILSYLTSFVYACFGFFVCVWMNVFVHYVITIRSCRVQKQTSIFQIPLETLQFVWMFITTFSILKLLAPKLKNVRSMFYFLFSAFGRGCCCCCCCCCWEGGAPVYVNHNFFENFILCVHLS